MNSHPTAIIETGATIADDVEIGPYAIISAGARIASGCRIGSHVHLLGDVTLGEDCQLGPGAIIGADPQSIGFDSTIKSGVIIGARNTIREYATIHRSLYEGKNTQIGNDNFLMTGAHLGHDCILGNHSVIANNCLIAGHVEVGDRCFLGGGSVYHQFIRIGDLVMVQGLAGLSQDVPPCLIASGINRIAGLNVVGMRRAEAKPAERKELKQAFELFYQSGLNLTQALSEAKKREWNGPAERFISFFQSESKRGFCLQSTRRARNEP